MEQQALTSLHRVRNVWMRTRTARINSLRGLCREFGLHIAQGARVGLEQIARVLVDPNSPLPLVLRPTMRSLIDELVWASCGPFSALKSRFLNWTRQITQLQEPGMQPSDEDTPAPEAAGVS